MKKITVIVTLLCTFMLTVPNMKVQAAESKGKVLLVASSTNTIELRNGYKMPTGYYLI